MNRQLDTIQSSLHSEVMSAAQDGTVGALGTVSFNNPFARCEGGPVQPGFIRKAHQAAFGTCLSFTMNPDWRVLPSSPELFFPPGPQIESTWASASRAVSESRIVVQYVT